MLEEGTAWEYIGENIFVRFNGYEILLQQNSENGREDFVFLDPESLDGLLKFLKKAKITPCNFLEVKASE